MLGGSGTGGVAYAAHLGGFAGLLLIKLFVPRPVCINSSLLIGIISKERFFITRLFFNNEHNCAF